MERGSPRIKRGYVAKTGTKFVNSPHLLLQKTPLMTVKRVASDTFAGKKISQ